MPRRRAAQPRRARDLVPGPDVFTVFGALQQAEYELFKVRSELREEQARLLALLGKANEAAGYIERVRLMIAQQPAVHAAFRTDGGKP